MVIHTYLFFLRAKAHRGGQDAKPQRNNGALGLTFRLGGQASLLCAFPTLQPAPQNCGELFFFFYILAKTHRGGQDAEPQRNCDVLGLTFRRGGQASLFCAFPTLQPAP